MSLAAVVLAAALAAVSSPFREDPGYTARTVHASGFFGASDIQCVNCAPLPVQVQVSTYDPRAGEINCWDYRDGYCWSPTWFGLPWEVAWGWSAACPVEWPVGSWLEIPDLGTFVCLDHGEAIVCKQDPAGRTCLVDLLTAPTPLNGRRVTATLWVPLKHWTERRKP